MQGNMQKLKGSWNELLGQAKERWGDLTDDDLKIAEGNMDQLVGRIQKRTGEARDAIVKALNEFADSGESVANRASKAVGQVAEQVGERLRGSSDYIAAHAEEGYAQARRYVSQRPGQSVAVMFGAGIALGLLVGLTLRSR